MSSPTPTLGIAGLLRALTPFALGFRPFYLVAACLAVAWIPLWVAVWHGHLALPTGFSPSVWHTHEMLFGFTSAVLVGFLLTAIPNWTGRPTVTGAPLAGLVVLWIAGRVLMLTGADLPWQVVAGVDVAFLPLAAAVMLPPLLAAGNRRNIGFPFVLMALALANLALHLDAAGIVSAGIVSAGIVFDGAGVTRGVLGAMMVILVVMGGRVIPFFTKNRLPAAGAGIDKRLDRLAIGATVAAVVLAVAVPSTIASGFAALAAAVLLIARALPLGMMARTARGHTGRPIEATRLMTAAFAIVNLAAVLRVFGPIAAPEAPAVIGASAILWALAFLLYLVEYAPILVNARIDGRPG